MTPAQLALAAVLVGTVLLQAGLPAWRLLILTSGAASACLVASLAGVSTTARLLAGVPWDVVVILVALGLLSEVFVASRAFGLLALAATRWSGAGPRRVLALFAVGMYGLSGLVNNLTALVLVLPVLLAMMRLLGVTQRYVSWTLGTVLVACNLGGAATPIGDFPAILLLGRGAMTFGDYLAEAPAPTALALAAMLALVLGVARPEREMQRNPLGARLTLATLAALHRNVRLDLRHFLPAAAALAAMLAAWLLVPPSSGVGPELVAWLGCGAALACVPRLGEKLVRSRVDVEAALTLLALFVMVGAVRESGVFRSVAAALAALPLGPSAQLSVFLVVTAALTGVFSAGPSMASMLEVAEVLAARYPAKAVYVGLALAVCAGSSLFLTAATSGPLCQALTERAGLRTVDGTPIRFGFAQYAAVGALGFVVTLAVALGYGLLALGAAPQG